MPMAMEGVARNTARGGQRDVLHLMPKIFRKIAFPPRLSLADRIIHASPLTGRHTNRKALSPTIRIILGARSLRF
jgi:hypothetical protein